jgi:LemA protein
MRTVSKVGVVTVTVAVLALILGGTCVSQYNKLVRLDQGTAAQWAQVENAYQRRADLVPNLVATVKGAAEFERGTPKEVTGAREWRRVPSQDISTDPEKFKEFQQCRSSRRLARAG